MEFITDDQTVHDLDLFGDDRQGPNVFSLWGLYTYLLFKIRGFR